MITKEILEDMMLNWNKKPIIIKTNVANGRGINGVEYSSYIIGEKKWQYSGFKYQYREGKISTCHDTYVTLVYHSWEEDREIGPYKYDEKHVFVYLPYESIVAIENEI